LSLSSLFLSAAILDEESIHSWRNIACYLASVERRELDKRNYRHDLRRAQFIYGRLLLKLLLVRRMNFDFGLIDIRTSINGRPTLFLRNSHVESVSLSIAHSGYTVFVSVGLNCVCGVDVQSIRGIDWHAVERAMGWSVSNEFQWSGIGFDVHQAHCISRQVRCGLVWSAYEAWMKLHGCQLPSTEFSWHHIGLLETDPVTHAQIFEMDTGHRCSYSKGRILLMSYSDEVFAVATQES
jgi:phosphopantetheinyl transferase